MKQRETLYRGKRIDGNNNWAYGSLITDNKDKCYLISPPNLAIGDNNTIGNTSVQPVKPETVGQFTGWEASGTKIFNGDKIQNLNIPENIGVVFWNIRKAAWGVAWNEEKYELFSDYSGFDNYNVIGSIYTK